MVTIKAGGSNVVFLDAGQVLNVQSGANSAGTIYKCSDSSGTTSSASYAVGSNSSLSIGPFSSDFLMRIFCSAGSITASETSGSAYNAGVLLGVPPPSVAPYLGIVATRCGCLDGGFVAGMIASTNRSAHFATEDLTSIKVIYANWTVSSNAESNMDSAASLVAYIEYPIDTYTPVTFNGASSGVAAPGANFISDFVSVNIPRGALFYVRAGFGLTGATTNGIPSNSKMLPNWGAGATTGSYWEGVLNSASLASVSLAGTKGSGGTSGNSDGFATNFTNRILPLGILGMTTRPSFFITGDSIGAGVADSVDSQLACGFIARALGNKYGYVNTSVSGEQVNGLTNNAQFLQRSFMAQYCTHVISNYGTNDIGTASGRTAAQVIADISAFRAKWFAGKRFYQCTLLPRTTSTDAFITETNQTLLATDAVRAAFNDQLRIGALTTRFDGILDVDQIVQNSYIGRKWKAFGTTTNALTSDGTHPTVFGAQYIASQLNISRMV